MLGMLNKTYISSHPIADQILRDLIEFYSIVCSIPAIPIPTHYSNIQSYDNSVIDLVFLYISCAQVSHCIEPDLR